MGKWQIVNRCCSCGKIYPRAFPEVCESCGITIGRPCRAVISPLLTIDRFRLEPTENLEKVVARKTIFNGWKIDEKEG